MEGGLNCSVHSMDVGCHIPHLGENTGMLTLRAISCSFHLHNFTPWISASTLDHTVPKISMKMENFWFALGRLLERELKRSFA